MSALVIVLLLNLGFAAAISRLSNWYKLKVEHYLLHMLCLNLVVALLYVSKYTGMAADYPLPIRFFVALILVYISAEPFRKRLLRQITLILDRFRSKSS